MVSYLEIPTWDKKYAVGIQDIDFQHQYFLYRINRFDIQVKSGLSEVLISAHLQEIIDYNQFHFYSEENIMLLYNF